MLWVVSIFVKVFKVLVLFGGGGGVGGGLLGFG